MAEKTHRIDYEKYIKDLAEFMDANGCSLRPFPKVRLSNKKQDGVFIRTAYYDPDLKEVTLFIRSRHIKDCLRSLAHEFFHHHQNIEGRLVGYNGDTLGQDGKLDELESEAYQNGNILFRKWTETKTKSEKPQKTFSKHMKKQISMNESNGHFNFGQYKGEKISDIIINNPDYCLWIIKNLKTSPFTEKQRALLDSVFFQKRGVFPLKTWLTPKYIKINGTPITQMSSDELQEIYNNGDDEIKWLVKQEHKNRGWRRNKQTSNVTNAPAFQSDDIGDEAWKMNENAIKNVLYEIINEIVSK